MTHDESTRNQTSERYLLGDLSPEARDAFEAHYFDCPECAEDVRLGMVLADNAKASFEDPELRRRRAEPVAAERTPRLSWLRLPSWASALAACVFAAVAGYDSWEVRQLQQPQIVSSTVLRAASRGEAQVIPIGPQERFFELTLDADLPPGASAGYRCEVLSDSGASVASVVVPATTAGTGPLRLRLASGRFSSGRYVAVLRSADRELDRFPFTLTKE